RIGADGSETDGVDVGPVLDRRDGGGKLGVRRCESVVSQTSQGHRQGTDDCYREEQGEYECCRDEERVAGGRGTCLVRQFFERPDDTRAGAVDPFRIRPGRRKYGVAKVFPELPARREVLDQPTARFDTAEHPVDLPGIEPRSSKE